ncbi:MAG: hypothetical protein WDZ59_08260 [Pirellulales bacterium]
MTFHLCGAAAACRALIAVLLAPAVASAQIDTPAARQARAALTAVGEAYSQRPEWPRLWEQLGLPDVQYELQAGESGNPAVLEAAVQVLRSGSAARVNDPPLVRLARTLEIRARDLTPLPAADWPAACRDQAADYAPVTDEALDAGGREFSRRLNQFAAWFPAAAQNGSSWNEFLFWEETRRLATPEAAATSAATLDRLETRWASAPSVWDAGLLYETSLAARQYIRLLRSYQKGETAQQHAAAWNALADQLEAMPDGETDTSQVAAAVNERESLGQASRLTASIRRALSLPNLVLHVPTDWIEEQLASTVDEPYEVGGVFAGTYSRGSGRMVGTLRGIVLPSEAVGRWLMRFDGTSTARTSGSSDRVYVASRATTRLAALKPFMLDARGLSPGNALATASTSIQYEQIDAPGILAMRRNAAVQETYSRRPQAEAESAAYARSSIVEQMNAEADQIAREFNDSYHARFRDPRVKAHRPSPDVRVRTFSGVLRWECRLEGPHDFAAPTPPPAYEPGSEIVMSLAASALEEQAAVTLGGRAMSGDEMSESLGSSLVRDSEDGGDDVHVTFEPDPCDVNFEDGAVHARLYITKFDAGDVQYPAMTVDLAYRPEERDGEVVFVRQGRLRVSPLTREGDNAPTISGRQQALRLAVQRRLERLLPDELRWSEASVPLPGEGDAVLQLERVRLIGPWLQMGLSATVPSGS